MIKRIIKNKLKNDNEEIVEIKLYASGEFLIKTRVNYHNRVDTSYVDKKMFNVMKEMEDSQTD